MLIYFNKYCFETAHNEYYDTYPTVQICQYFQNLGFRHAFAIDKIYFTTWLEIINSFEKTDDYVLKSQITGSIPFYHKDVLSLFLGNYDVAGFAFKNKNTMIQYQLTYG